MPLFDFSPLLRYAEEKSIALPAHVSEQLNTYAALLLEWNEKINLTAITEPKEVIEKHFIDSLSLLHYYEPKQGESLLDVGTGAGFPGMVLKILRPDLSVTLLDGHAKRFLFLEDLQNRLGLTVTNLHARAELAAKETCYREQFDLVTARAVARLPILAEYCLPFVKPDGVFFAMKGPDGAEELSEAATAISLLGGGAPSLFTERLPGNHTRVFIRISKQSKTPGKYPRASGQIKKKPLSFL